MLQFHFHFWPILTTLWLCLTFIISYAIAVGNGDTYGIFPYISDTGTLPPESCIFGLMLSIGAFLSFVTLYFRYRYVQIKEKQSNTILWKWNIISFYIGAVSCFGLLMVASFQETSNMAGHIIGANLAFLIGAIYFLIQVYLSWHLTESYYIKWIRIFLGVVILPLFIMTMVFSATSIGKLKPDHTVDMLWWTENREGYTEHLIASISEWLMASTLVLFIFTFTSEFKEVEYEGIHIRAKINSQVP